MKSMTKQNTMIISPFALKHFKHFATLGIINVHSITLHHIFLFISSAFYMLLYAWFFRNSKMKHEWILELYNTCLC